ncbi:MAG: hypothetical protein JNL02_11355 [Saprospiraceae bacterium]|nr:hypothetical protein [Saprospiraceae bacterium]
MQNKRIAEIIDLVNEKLSPKEAIELLDALVGERIQWHNIHMLRQWEGNHQFDARPFDQKINELRAQKKSVRAFLAAAREQGLNVELVARIEVRLARKPIPQDFIFELTSN